MSVCLLSSLLRVDELDKTDNLLAKLAKYQFYQTVAKYLIINVHEVYTPFIPIFHIT